MTAMSKDKAEEKARSEQKVQKWLLDKGLHNLVISTRFDKENTYVSDAIINYTDDISTENTQLRDILREIVELTDKMMVSQNDFEYNIASVQRGNAITKAKKLLTDNTKEDEKVD